MASASVLTATPALPTFYSVDHFRKPSSSSTSPYLGSPPSKSFHPPPTIAGPAYNDLYEFTANQSASPSAVATPTTPTKPNTSTHAKLHKKAIARSPQRGSGINGQHQQADHAFAGAQSPPATPSPNKYSLDYDIPIQTTQKSPAKQAKSIIKQNLRKLSHAPDDQTATIDLSKTAEENEKRSGLGLAPGTLLRNSRSVDVLGSGTVGKQHTRSYSHVSQLSTTSIVYQPPTPFIPLLPSGNVYSPTATYGFSSPAFPTTDFGPPTTTYHNTTEDLNPYTGGRSRGLTIDSANSGGANSSQKQSSRVHSSRSSTRHKITTTSNTSQTNLSSFTRPRRSSTNHSVDISANPGRSRTSFDRAFTFRSHSHVGENDPQASDPAAQRAATIQAARQAFDDRQEAKARKYEEKEARATVKQIKKEEKQRRKSTVSVTGRGHTRTGSKSPEHTHTLPGGAIGTGGSTEEIITGATTFSAFPMLSTLSSHTHEAGNPGFASSGDYADIRPSTSHSANTPSPYYESPMREDLEGGSGVSARGGAGEKAQHVPPVSRKRAAKSRYFRFLSWLKTKILNMERAA